MVNYLFAYLAMPLIVLTRLYRMVFGRSEPRQRASGASLMMRTAEMGPISGGLVSWLAMARFARRLSPLSHLTDPRNWRHRPGTLLPDGAPLPDTGPMPHRRMLAALYALSLVCAALNWIGLAEVNASWLVVLPLWWTGLWQLSEGIRARDREARIRALIESRAPELQPELAAYDATLGGILDALEAQPARLAVARAHLGPELEALELATEKLSVVLAAGPDEYALGSYRNSLGRMTSAAQGCLNRLRAAASRDLELELGMLGDRLARRG